MSRWTVTRLAQHTTALLRDAQEHVQVPPHKPQYTFMHLAEHNIYKWLADIFTTLEHIQGASDGATLAAVEAPSGGTPVLDSL